MKPLGPIPPGFAADAHGVLTIAEVPATEWIVRAGGTPLFVYASATITERVAALRAAMPADLAVHYAVKANPFPPLLALMAGLVDGFDIASAGELALAQAAGVPPADIGFAGPGKSDAELRAAIAAGVTLSLESANEATRALALAARLGIRPRLAIRVNPDFALKGAGMRMGGGASPFGIDAPEVPALARAIVAAGAQWRGLHIYAGSQMLDAKAIIAAQQATLALAAELGAAAGLAVPWLNLGGGFGIPYFHGDTPLDIVAVGHALGEALATARARWPAVLGQTRVGIELGRWLVGEAGVYLTRILDRKTSHGTVFLVTDGGLHHMLAASGNFGTVVRRNYPLAVATRFGAPADEIAQVVGRLCTPLDRLAEAASLPRAEVGDIIAVFCAGAYGASASPSMFLGHGPAREMLG